MKIKRRNKEKKFQTYSKVYRVITFVTSMAVIFTTIASIFATTVFAAGSSNSGLSVASVEDNKKDAKLSDDEKNIMEKIMKGLSTFKYKVYEWPENLTVGGLSFSIAESLYTMRNNKTHNPILWTDDTIEDEMKSFYSSTDWNNFEGMFETVEISNSCEAILSDEVAAYEELMDKAAENHGFVIYKEIFKAIGQTRFNEHKVHYEELKAQGKIHGKGSDPFDLFHINGSWIDGGNTPVGTAKAPTPTPIPPKPPKPTGEPILPIPTSMPDADANSPFENQNEDSQFTVEQSIEIAAKSFSYILENAVFPSPYDTNKLISVVQSFEFGGSSNSIKGQFNSSPVKLPDSNKFIPFEQYCDKNAAAGGHSESESQEEVDYDAIIEKYAKVVAHGQTRGSNDIETYGKYKYSDQKFYQKVFENYKCSGGGSIEYGALPDDMKSILQQCMKTWDSRVTKERRAIIQNGVLLYGVTYSMESRNSPSLENPQYLDCSSFVGQCYWRAGVLGQETAYWTTGSFASEFSQIDESQLIPGDIAQISWNPGGSGGSEHIGIYIGTVNGRKYYIHCAGGYTDGIYHAPGKGIKVNDYSGFTYFGRCPGL